MNTFHRTTRKFSDLRYEVRSIYTNRDGMVRVKWFNNVFTFNNEVEFDQWLSSKHLEEVVVVVTSNDDKMVEFNREQLRRQSLQV